MDRLKKKRFHRETMQFVRHLRVSDGRIFVVVVLVVVAVLEDVVRFISSS